MRVSLERVPRALSRAVVAILAVAAAPGTAPMLLAQRPGVVPYTVVLVSLGTEERPGAPTGPGRCESGCRATR